VISAYRSHTSHTLHARSHIFHVSRGVSCSFLQSPWQARPVAESGGDGSRQERGDCRERPHTYVKAFETEKWTWISAFDKKFSPDQSQDLRSVAKDPGEYILARDAAAAGRAGVSAAAGVPAVHGGKDRCRKGAAVVWVTRGIAAFRHSLSTHAKQRFGLTREQVQAPLRHTTTTAWPTCGEKDRLG
jgi:hypothetical protein